MILNVTNGHSPCSREIRIASIGFLQLLVNKFGATKEKIEGDERTLLQIMTELIEEAASSEGPEVVVKYQVLAYFAFAALACIDETTEPLIGMMLQGISHPTVGRKVAQSFRTLLEPSPIINQEHFCILRPLRKGRLYSLAVPQLIDMYRKYGNRDYLVAMTYVLKYMETPMLVSHAAEIFPYILEGTNADEAATKLICIEILIKLLPECPELGEQHLDSIIARMTDRTHNTYYSPSDATTGCRVQALIALAVLTKTIRPVLLLKRRGALVMELDLAVDDCQRDVRHKAEQCKMAWFNIQGSEADDS